MQGVTNKKKAVVRDKRRAGSLSTKGFQAYALNIDGTVEHIEHLQSAPLLYWVIANVLDSVPCARKDDVLEAIVEAKLPYLTPSSSTVYKALNLMYQQGLVKRASYKADMHHIKATDFYSAVMVESKSALAMFAASLDLKYGYSRFYNMANLPKAIATLKLRFNKVAATLPKIP